jgi:IS30 family transposase
MESCCKPLPRVTKIGVFDAVESPMRLHRWTPCGVVRLLCTMISISERPPDVEDRVPGNWAYVVGMQNQTATGTLVERSTGYVMLVHLPEGYKPEQVRDVLAAKIKTLPDSLRLSLTRGQGPEMPDWKTVSVSVHAHGSEVDRSI